MSGTYSVIEDDVAGALPPSVAVQLLDLGLACNAASLAYRQALLVEEQANQTLAATRESDPAVQFRRFAADEEAEAALDMADQRLATYAVLTATYATFAASMVSCASAGTLTDVDPVKPVAPSRLLTDPDGALPILDLPPATADDDLAEQLRRKRQAVTSAASNARASGVADCYDGRTAAAARPSGAVDLSEDVPDGLHAYAALLVEVLGLLITDPQA